MVYVDVEGVWDVWLIVDDREVEECDSSSIQPVPPNSVQNLKFKAHFFEVVEELRMKRVCTRNVFWKSAAVSLLINMAVHCMNICQLISL